MGEAEIAGYRPGAIGRITELHATYYHEHWGFDLAFEAEVATELAEFLGRFDAARDGLWLALVDGRIVGSIAIDGSQHPNTGARLRWFILAPRCQGRGIGRRLMREAMGFCRVVGIRRVYLWTFAGLDAARHLYEDFGFVLRGERSGSEWGRPVTHQMFDVILATAPEAEREARRAPG